MDKISLKPSLIVVTTGWSLSAFAGTSDPAGIAAGIFNLLVGVILLVAIATLLVAGIAVKGWLKAPAVLVVMLFWGWLYQVKVAMPIQASTQERGLFQIARGLCEGELSSFSPFEPFFPVDGILDEASSLRKQHLLQLLSERKLKFVEFKVQKSHNGSKIVEPNDAYSGNPWEVNSPAGTFIRIKLGVEGEPGCVADKDLPLNIQGRTQKPPFLPNTCIKASVSEKSTARYAITHSRNGPLAISRLDHWQLVDRKQNLVLAELTTIDPPDHASLGMAEAIRSKPSLSDCRFPHTILADRLMGVDQSIVGHPQLVELKTVVASVSPKTLDPGVDSAPQIRATADMTALDEEESRQIFGPYMAKHGWKNAVIQAEKTGWGAYGEQLLDWKNRQLITLKLTDGNDHPWKSSGGDDGFWVRSTESNWYQRPANLLARYSAEGQLLWTASVIGTEMEVLPEGCEMAPYAMTFDTKFVSLHKPCRKVKSTNEGLVWKIKRQDLKKVAPSASPAARKP